MINKKLEQLSLKELAEIHLDVDRRRTYLINGWISSNMHHLVREIRATRVRQSTKHFSPLYCAFALLDQVGSTYRNEDMDSYNNDSASGIKKALYYFGGMTRNGAKTKALYGLRNSLMHNASLLYRGRFKPKSSEWKGPHHKFVVNPDIDMPIMLPACSWNGSLDNLQHFNATEVNIEEICKLAIKCVYEAQKLLDDENISMIVTEEKELYYRYLHHRKHNG